MANKYEIIKKSILDKILRGTYQKDQQLPTESDMMSDFSVSRYTVRRAISDLENEKFVYRVQGGGSFVADWSVTKKFEDAPKVIGILSTHVASYIFPAIIDGADQVLSENGFSLVLANTHNDPVRERTALTNLMGQNLGGLIIEPTQSALDTTNIDLYQKLDQMNIPMVFINAAYNNFEGTKLVSDDKLAFDRATNYLIKRGHKKIVGVFQVSDSQGVHRMAGYLKAYQDHPNILPYCTPIMYKSDEVNDALRAISELLAKKPEQRPTAIIAYNDQLAIRTIDLIHDVGLKVPEDISVIGFDDFQLSQYLSPRLTTMTHAKEDMGKDAAQLLLQKIKHHKTNSVVYSSKLIERESVRDIG
ncbi:GntR family transcriptional regulator [Leuconostoc gasicomitatum]|uniref:Transcriptional repressor of arabinoside utilization operon, GntR family n=1 Tax=Leuconostoc inhae TaxID=178001 RepID=A0AAN2QWF8_9LACO|nr:MULTISPECIES: GntR family transcriptional regulator [Leuconostoc]MBZ5947392.1 GntR family transcriptional regulator [Leuconostoc gasicomitatum]MBZ5956922.1 GntR family transcriptional regulator [Leuconostoc gasicomitatum]MBZ5958308.1 GntR family transcriptional regulator [Leuconostoc gasicomitatum]MBZ5960582.1 GntR family transcriptional regulator [Leuconostoc gasicomitatum]MBZ5965272.1 GntR family transcriptional regulator [Leuconostoc gasicomitatum]